MKKILTLLTLSLLLSCSSKEEKQLKEATELYKASMDMHDSVMPHMDKIYSLQTTLHRQLDSLRQDSVSNAPQLNVLRSHLAALETAATDMMDWMHNIKDVPGAKGHHHGGEASKTGTPEEILAQQQEQKSRIETVKKEMETAIEAAEGILKKK